MTQGLEVEIPQTNSDGPFLASVQQIEDTNERLRIVRVTLFEIETGRFISISQANL